MQTVYYVPRDLLWSILAHLSDDDNPENQRLAHRLRLLLNEQRTGVPVSPPLSEEELRLKQEILKDTREWYAKKVAGSGKSMSPDEGLVWS